MSCSLGLASTGTERFCDLCVHGSCGTQGLPGTLLFQEQEAEAQIQPVQFPCRLGTLLSVITGVLQGSLLGLMFCRDSFSRVFHRA